MKRIGRLLPLFLVVVASVGATAGADPGSDLQSEGTYAEALVHYSVGGQAWSLAWGETRVSSIRHYLVQSKAAYTACLNTAGSVDDPTNAANLALLRSISNAYINLADAAFGMYDGADIYASGRMQMAAGDFTSAASSFQTAAASFADSQTLFDQAVAHLVNTVYEGTDFGDGAAYTGTIIPVLGARASYMNEFATYALGWQQTALAYQAHSTGRRDAFSDATRQAMDYFASLRQSTSFGADATSNYKVLATLMESAFPTATPTETVTMTPTKTPTSAPGSRIVPVFGSDRVPIDPDGDGLYQDVNGNGRTDFADAVLFFNQMAWIEEHEPLSAFDFNRNGRIDFADVTRLFNQI